MGKHPHFRGVEASWQSDVEIAWIDASVCAERGANSQSRRFIKNSIRSPHDLDNIVAAKA
jgi:uncharacterized membrane protein YebE (DUF533 family)